VPPYQTIATEQLALQRGEQYKVNNGRAHICTHARALASWALLTQAKGPTLCMWVMVKVACAQLSGSSREALR